MTNNIPPLLGILQSRYTTPAPAVKEGQGTEKVGRAPEAELPIGGQQINFNVAYNKPNIDGGTTINGVGGANDAGLLKAYYA